MLSAAASREAAPRARLEVSLVAASLALVCALCLLRLSCIALGPDPDTDAYGHYVIARLLWDAPFNFKLHWVWLPLYHALLSLPVQLGATLDQVRAANALLALLPPALLLSALAAPRPAPAVIAPATEPRALPSEPLGPLAVPCLAAALVALCPLTMQLGTTGQMEIFFCSLTVLAACLLQRERTGAAALALSALVLTRYEGWAVAAVVGAELGRRWLRGARLGSGGWACLLAPGLCVLGWAALRRLGGEAWFSFITDNQAFAEHALAGAPRPALSFARYVTSVPLRAFGPALLFAPFGLRRALRRHGPWLVTPGLGLLAFLTLSALSRSQLGLDRHFVSVVPFAAAWIAHGVAAIVERTSAAFGRGRVNAPWLALGAALALASVAARLDASWPAWRETTRHALPEARAAAAFVRETPASSLIVCNDAAVEVLSGLGPERFWRVPLDPHAPGVLVEQARSRQVYVVSRASRLAAFGALGPVRHGTLEGPSDAFVAVLVLPPELR